MTAHRIRFIFDTVALVTQREKLVKSTAIHFQERVWPQARLRHEMEQVFPGLLCWEPDQLDEGQWLDQTEGQFGIIAWTEPFWTRKTYMDFQVNWTMTLEQDALVESMLLQNLMVSVVPTALLEDDIEVWMCAHDHRDYDVDDAYCRCDPDNYEGDDYLDVDQNAYDAMPRQVHVANEAIRIIKPVASRLAVNQQS
jgi:hypothetical protein